MQSKAATVAEYLAELPDDRRAAIEAVRQVILDNLDGEFEEGMQYGMIGYYVPHRVYPGGYHCDPKQPLPFAALASQKSYMSVYLMSVYCGGATRFEKEWARSGKKLDMGKCCVRFRKLDDLALDVIGDAIGRVTAREWIAVMESNTRSTRKQPASKKPSRKKTAAVKGKKKAAREKR